MVWLVQLLCCVFVVDVVVCVVHLFIRRQRQMFIRDRGVCPNKKPLRWLWWWLRWWTGW